MTHPTLYMFVCLFIWVSPVAVCCWSIPTYIAALCLSIYTTRLFPPLSSYVKSVVLALQSPIACPQMERRYSRGVIASTTEFGAIQERKRGIWLIVTTNTISLLQRLKRVASEECPSRRMRQSHSATPRVVPPFPLSLLPAIRRFLHFSSSYLPLLVPFIWQCTTCTLD